MTKVIHRCPNCENNDLKIIYEVDQVPVHSVRLVTDRAHALDYPTGSMKLGYCSHCTFISNIAFDPEKMHYAEDYEETQGYSSTFREFHKELARDLVDRLGLREKTVLEIGCGKGEFLELLISAGAGRAIGFDPAWVPGRTHSASKSQITVFAENYSSKHAEVEADVYCCKMTLEHIPNPREFVRMLRQSIGNRENVNVFFMLPDTERILREQAFQDIYYEHCSYFSQSSLEYLFKSNGFRVSRLGKVYDDQYLTIEAVPVSQETEYLVTKEDRALMTGLVNIFSENINRMQQSWHEYLCRQAASGKRVVLWGGGSKAVAFLTTMQIADEIGYVIDINPHKQGCFLPKTGHRVSGPDELLENPADIVVIMNPAYQSEIKNWLNANHLQPLLLTLDSPRDNQPC